jgi:acyl-coenzyme A thioesterase PaaI-like protein
MKRILGSGLAVAAVAGAVLVGCEVGSPDTVIAQVGLTIAGFYANLGGTVVSTNTGLAIQTLNLIQDGTDLQAIDNNGRVFRGSISTASDTAAQINLQGTTTAGAQGTIQASVNVAGGTATMQGTWIEPSLYGTVYGTATVPTNGGSSSSITIAGPSVVSNNSTTTFTATGGSGTFTWSVSNSGLGAITGSGASGVYIANATDGTQTIRVTASGGGSANKTVTQQ